MLKENALVKISDDMFVDRMAMDKLISDIKTLKSKNPKFGVGEFKDLTGVSRKYAIPLLEYLDRQRVTRRVGDESEDAWMKRFLGIELPEPQLPATEVRREFLGKYPSCRRDRPFVPALSLGKSANTDTAKSGRGQPAPQPIVASSTRKRGGLCIDVA
jgi:hypothetical protein